MTTEFQPEKPHPETEGPGPISFTSIVVAAFLSSVTVVLILAVGVPRVITDEELGLGITLGLGALAFLAVIAGGYYYRRSEE